MFVFYCFAIDVFVLSILGYEFFSEDILVVMYSVPLMLTMLLVLKYQ